MPGLVPTKGTDIPIASVLLVIFLGLLVSNVLIFRQNKRAGTPFTLTSLLIIYSIFRTAAMALRIAFATASHNVNLTIASSILANAGVVLVIILNLLLSPILFRSHFGAARLAARPALRKLTNLPFMLPIPLVPIFLLVIVNVSILSFFTTDMQVRQHCQTAQKVALVTFAVIAFIPALPALALALVGSGSSPARANLPAAILNPAPGFGSTRANALLISLGSSILTLGSAIRAAALLLPPRMADDPAWYQERPAYYIFTFVTEILVVAAYTLFRVDRRFQAPRDEAGGEKQLQRVPRAGETEEEDGEYTPREEAFSDTFSGDTFSRDTFSRDGQAAEYRDRKEEAALDA